MEVYPQNTSGLMFHNPWVTSDTSNNKRWTYSFGGVSQVVIHRKWLSQARQLGSSKPDLKSSCRVCRRWICRLGGIRSIRLDGWIFCWDLLGLAAKAPFLASLMKSWRTQPYPAHICHWPIYLCPEQPPSLENGLVYGARVGPLHFLGAWRPQSHHTALKHPMSRLGCNATHEACDRPTSLCPQQPPDLESGRAMLQVLDPFIF